jgi:hypothetical protein
MVGDDETDQLGLRVDRWRYPRLQDRCGAYDRGVT